MKQVFLILGFLVVIIVGFFVYSTTACIGCEDVSEEKIFKTVSAVEFDDKISDEDVVLIDIRTPSEFNSGHLDGALNIDFYSASFKEELDKLDKNAVYAIYCRTDSRSGQAMNLIKNLGFREVYELDGGITFWIASDFPVVY